MAERIRLVVTVKAYPSASVKYGEAVCVAGIRTDTDLPEWVRLYPVEFRDLPLDRQFKKWSEIELDVTASSDHRPESRRPHTDTITLVSEIGSERGWANRRPLVEPLLVESMCQARRDQALNGRSLAAFRPYEVRDVLIEPEPDDWDAKQLNALSQLSFFAADKQTLERIPWAFRYHYFCDDPACGGHRQKIIDWEIAQAWRSWRWQYGSEGAADRVREKWLSQLCGPEKDTVFFAGNQHRHPDSFLVLGVYWPPRRRSEDVKNVQGLW